MSFVYNSTEIAEQNITTFDGLLVAVKKAIELFPGDESIQEFHAWLLQLPAYYESDSGCDDSDCDDCDPEYDNYDDEELSKAAQYGVSKILLQRESYQAYIVGEKLWILSANGLLLLSQVKTDPRSVTVPAWHEDYRSGTVTVPLWYPNFEAFRIVESLYWLKRQYTFVYEVVPKVFITVKGKHPQAHVELVSSAGVSPEYLEFATKIENKEYCSIDLPLKTSFTMREDGTVLVRDRDSAFVVPMSLV